MAQGHVPKTSSSADGLTSMHSGAEKVERTHGHVFGAEICAESEWLGVDHPDSQKREIRQIERRIPYENRPEEVHKHEQGRSQVDRPWAWIPEVWYSMPHLPQIWSSSNIYIERAQQSWSPKSIKPAKSVKNWSIYTHGWQRWQDTEEL